MKEILILIYFTFFFISNNVYSSDFLKINKNDRTFANSENYVFIENVGQFLDQNHNSRNDIDTKLATGNGLNIFVGRQGLHYQYSRPLDSTHTDMYRMDVELLNSNPDAKLLKEEEQYYYETYYTPPFSPDHGATAHSFKRLTYLNIYPNIDWTLYIKDNKLEYDFIVHPGGNVKDINIQYRGTNDLALQGDGSIKVINPMGEVNELAPVSYLKENGESIQVFYCINNKRISFNSEACEGTLVIDPVLEWATYYGGSNDDNAWIVSNDTLGNIYIVGFTNSNNNIVTNGAFETNTNGSSSSFLSKFDSNGNLIWGTYFAYPAGSWTSSICIDKSSFIYIVGAISSTSSFATNNAYQSVFGGVNDGFIGKFDTSGNLDWATFFGGPLNDNISSITCDNSGNLYVIGSSQSSSGIATPNAFQQYISDSSDAFIAKFDSSGNRIWCTYYGGLRNDYGMGITYNINGALYLVGSTASVSGIATSSSFQASYGGGYSDLFVARFDTSGHRVWATYYGGNNQENSNPNTITNDRNGNIYITGGTASNNNIATINSFQSTYTAGNNFTPFLVKFDANGNRIWGTYIGGNAGGEGQCVSCDLAGNIYCLGEVYSSISNIASTNAYQPLFGGGTDDGYIEKFSPTGVRIWGTYYGGTSNDGCLGVCVDNIGNLYFAGETRSTSSIATPGAHQTSIGSIVHSDAFLGKFSADTLFYINAPFIDTEFCVGDTFSLSFSMNFNFGTTNTFTAQLSDTSGNFITTTTIGSLSSSSSGTIFCTIPSNILPGNNYKIRIIGSNPNDTTTDLGINIHINAIPYHHVSYLNNCIGSTLTLKDSAINCTNFHWTGVNNFTSILQSPDIHNTSFADSGFYFVIDSFINGCVANDTLHVPIKLSPDKPVATSNAPVCLGDTVFFHASDITAGVSYLWTGPASYSSNLQNPNRPNFVYSDTGKYFVNAILNGCLSPADTLEVSLIANLVPAVSIISSRPLIIAGQTDTFTAIVSNCNNPVYQWYINGTALTGAYAHTFSITLTKNEQITVHVHCSGGCYSLDSAISNILIATESVENYQASNIKLYPNPVENELIIEGAENTSVKVYDVVGRIIYTNHITSIPHRINTSQWERGAYFVELVLPDGCREVRKVVK